MCAFANVYVKDDLRFLLIKLHSLCMVLLRMHIRHSCFFFSFFFQLCIHKNIYRKIGENVLARNADHVLESVVYMRVAFGFVFFFFVIFFFHHLLLYTKRVCVCAGIFFLHGQVRKDHGTICESIVCTMRLNMVLRSIIQ